MGISRHQLFTLLGIVKIVDPITDAAYKADELKIWQQKLGDSPHGQPWHTSFHASSFPGDSDQACGRAAVYGLMDLPESEPTSRWLRGLGDSGKNIEREVVTRWDKYGILLSATPDAPIQTGFTDSEHWLTGNCDAVIQPRGWNRPHVVEIKSKAHDKVLAMKNLERDPDEKHVRQLKAYVGFCHEQHDRLPWSHLDPCIDGTIYYVSRDDPTTTHEFTFSYDRDFMDAGRRRLAEWRDHYFSGTLPDRPRREDGKLVGWSETPCKWCPLKKHICKPDWQAQNFDLAESHAIEYAENLRPSYSYDEARKRVLDRWICTSDKHN